MNTWPLIGRTAEVATILDRLDRAVPAAVIIAGGSRRRQVTAAQRGRRTRR